MGSFRHEVTDLHGVEHLGSRQATLDNRYAERIAQEQKPLFEAEGAEEDTPVGVVFHFLGHQGERSEVMPVGLLALLGSEYPGYRVKSAGCICSQNDFP